MSIFDKWNKNIDGAALAQDVREAAANGGGGEYREVPHGDYVVAINKMELRESKKGDPMFTCWMKVVEGEYEGSMLFMNQVITQGFQLHIVNEFLRSLDSGVAVDFNGDYNAYNSTVMDVFEAVSEKLEYALEYGERKGFNTFKVMDVFEV